MGRGGALVGAARSHADHARRIQDTVIQRRAAGHADHTAAQRALGCGSVRKQGADAARAEYAPAPPDALLLSQAVGEPPLFMAASVFFALQRAAAAARAEPPGSAPPPRPLRLPAESEEEAAGQFDAWLMDGASCAAPFMPLKSPATCSRLRWACGCEFMELVQ